MNKKILIIIGFIMIAGLVLLSRQNKEIGSVEVAISPESRDLGTVIYGEVVTTEFTLTNFTPEDLTITKVSTSCGCTKAEVDKKFLAPYESTTVHASFDPAVHKDDTDLGELTRTIYIDTDNQNFPKVTSTITANVIKK